MAFHSFSSHSRQFRVLSNQSGVIVADFIFALILTAGMSILLFSLSYSMAVVEVTQYVAYSVSRAYSAGNKNHDEQLKKAQDKYTALVTGNTAIGTLYNSDWFKVASATDIDLRGGPSGNGRTFSDDLAGGNDRRGIFMGVSIPLTIGLLKFKFPLLGNTAPDHDEGFTTKINSMLIRDPTEQECKNFMDQRRDELRNLPSGKKFFEPSAYIPLEDNGC